MLAHWGLAAVFAGAMIEGETVVMAGGALAERGLYSVAAVTLSAFAGTVAMDQICFILGRRFRTHRWVCALRARPLFDRALGFIERYPSGYILAFRFLPGLRIISPIALGVSRVPGGRFVVLNLLAAAVWAPLFVAIGYGAGSAVERVLGRVQSGERYFLIVLVVIIAITLIGAGAHRWLGRATR